MSQTAIARTTSLTEHRPPAGCPEEGTPEKLTARVIDNDPDLLAQSYALRYQVYCLERRFLPASRYPERRETDEFDRHSIHIGVVNGSGIVVGTARLVAPTAGLPLFRHCRLYADAPRPKDTLSNRVVEASRLAVSRDGAWAAAELNGAVYKSGDIVLNIFRGLYQASKRNGFSHWLAATEKSLQRLMVKYGFPWTAVGPEADYYGKVAPYLMDLAEFDQVILRGHVPLATSFLDGLEPRFRPVKTDIWSSINSIL